MIHSWKRALLEGASGVFEQGGKKSPRLTMNRSKSCMPRLGNWPSPTFFCHESSSPDGKDFTADDIVFWWEHVETNTDIQSSPRCFCTVDGQNATVTKIDDYTVSFSWDKPNGLFLENMPTSYGVRVVNFAEHYHRQFSNLANPDGVAELMKAAGVDGFVAQID